MRSPPTAPAVASVGSMSAAVLLLLMAVVTAVALSVRAAIGLRRSADDLGRSLDALGELRAANGALAQDLERHRARVSTVSDAVAPGGRS